MPVKENLNIYAKWTSRVPVKFTVSYLVQEGGGYVKIADDTTGVSLAGVFKSFIPN
jgi:hypothetical protein